jgi:hypothetical protein
VPSAARVYDAVLGGKENFKVDREAADVFMSLIPQAREAALLNRAALIRGVRYMVRKGGIDQFIDIGCGLPIEPNTHEAAQEINPDASVVYVDNDPMVASHGRALFSDNRTTTVLTADLRDPAGILGNPEVRDNLDFDRPVGVMLGWILMGVADAEAPDEIIARLMEPLASGSHLFITTWPDTGDPCQRALAQACRETFGMGWCRPVEQIERHFQGMPLVAPGLEWSSRWYPEEPDRDVPAVADLETHERIQIAGIAVKP